MSSAARRTARSIVGGACSYALGGAVSVGLSGSSYAALVADAEYNNAVVFFLIVGAVIGAVGLGTIGAALGFVYASTGWWIRRPWILPLVSLGFGALFMASEWDSVWRKAAVAGWPIYGLVGGVLSHLLFRWWVGPQ